MTRFRAAFDLGSGATKMTLARSLGPRRWEPIFGEEKEVLVGYAVRTSTDNRIPAPIIAKLRTALQDFSDIIMSNVPKGALCESFGVATAVYRECLNGMEVLDQLSQEFRLPLKIISQQEEARVGFVTACLLSDASTSIRSDHVLTWDSGASSFQIVRGSRQGHALSNIFEGPWGNSKAFIALVEMIQKQVPTHPSSTCNPLSREQFNTFIEFLRHDLRKQKERAHFMQENGLSIPIITIGGDTSGFYLSSKLIRRFDNIRAAELRQAVERDLLGKTDEELKALNIPQVNCAVAKVALVVSVMEEFQLPPFTYFESVGTTMGLVGLEEFWKD